MREYDLTEQNFRDFLVNMIEATWVEDRMARGGCLYTAGRLDAAKEIWEKLKNV